MAEQSPFVRPLRPHRIEVPLTVNVPEHLRSFQNSVHYYDGMFGTTMDDYVRHQFNPLTDPGAEYLVPSTLKHIHKDRDQPKGTSEHTLPSHPYEHSLGMHDPLIYDAPLGHTKMFYSTHDQHTANPIHSVNSSLCLKQ